MVYKLVVKQEVDSDPESTLGHFSTYEQAKLARDEYIIYKSSGTDEASWNRMKDKVYISVNTEVEEI